MQSLLRTGFRCGAIALLLENAILCGCGVSGAAVLVTPRAMSHFGPRKAWHFTQCRTAAGRADSFAQPNPNLAVLAELSEQRPTRHSGSRPWLRRRPPSPVVFAETRRARTCTAVSSSTSRRQLDLLRLRTTRNYVSFSSGYAADARAADACGNSGNGLSLQAVSADGCEDCAGRYPARVPAAVANSTSASSATSAPRSTLYCPSDGEERQQTSRRSRAHCNNKARCRGSLLSPGPRPAKSLSPAQLRGSV